MALVTKVLIFCEQAGFELVTMLLRDAADVLQQNEESDALNRAGSHSVPS